MTDQAVKFVDTPLDNIIELRDIQQIYTSQVSWSWLRHSQAEEVVVIDGFNLLIEDKSQQGEFVVILGRSGCGKSTVLRYIAGLQKPTSGEVLINGQPHGSHTKAISMVFQQYSSLPWFTVLENVMLPMKFSGVHLQERRERAMQMLETVELAEHANKYAQQPQLSGGQLQRVAIARSLVSNPHIILMDEPFGALDTHTRFQMQLLLARIWKTIQCTIIFVTHDITEAVFLGDDIYIMTSHPGQIGKHIFVDLPLDRVRETKRSPRFLELVTEVDDAISGAKPV